MSFYENIEKAFESELQLRLFVALKRISEKTESVEYQLKNKLDTSLKNISEKFNISMEDLNKEFENIFDDTSMSLEDLGREFGFDDSLFDIKKDISKKSETKMSKKSSETKMSKKSSETKMSKKSSGTCIHIIQKGYKKGVCCGIKVKSGGVYCSKHKVKTDTPSNKESGNICIHMIQKGDKGVRCRLKVKSEGDYCYKHKPKNVEDKKEDVEDKEEDVEDKEEDVEDKEEDVEDKEEDVEDKEEDVEDKKEDLCKYVISKGVNKGQVCNNKTNSEDYCSKHMKSKVKKVPTPILPKAFLVKRKPIFKLNEKNIWVHHPTNFVSKGDDGIDIVVGKLCGETVKKLTDVDIEVCKEYNMSYDLDYDLCLVK